MRMKHAPPLILVLCPLLAFVACRAQATPVPLPTQPPSPTTLRVVMASPSQTPADEETPTRASRTTATPAPSATVSLTSPAAPTSCPAGEGPNIRYDLNAVVDLRMYTVRATQVVSFRNETGTALRELVLHVEPNRQPGVFSLIRLALADGEDVAAYELTGPRLTVTLPEALGINCTTSLRLDFVLAPLPIPSTRFRARTDHVGFSERQLNLGHWFPALPAYRPGEGWLIHAACGVGEHYALPVADFDFEITVEDAQTAQVVGPGTLTRIDEDTWRFRHTGGRDLALSIGRDYRMMLAETESGVGIEVYYFDEPYQGEQDAALHALNTGVGAVERYQALFGPMAFDRLVVVASDFRDGMEFSGLVFVGSEYFRYYSGSPAAWLTLITAHELSHQWWYALVGNDQAIDPWLDEALATYSELLYMEEAYPELANWWWDFRVTEYDPQGMVGKPIYDYGSRREYINAAYLRGVLMMQDLRNTVGDDAFAAWLRAYAGANAGRLACPADLWAALPDGVDLEEVERIRAWYGADQDN